MNSSLNRPTRVLLVDDDSVLLRSLVRVFEQHGFESETAIRPAEARLILNRLCYDVIICDQKMPGTTGLDFLTQIRNQYPDLILFMLSGHISGLPVAMKWADQICVSQVFSKPCDANKIAETIKTAVADKQVQQNTRGGFKTDLELDCEPQALASGQND